MSNKPQIPSHPADAADWLITTVEQEYATQYMDRCKMWYESGLYDEIARTLDVKPRGTHLDIGSGFGNLCMSLRSRYPNLQLYGVDSNSAIVDASVRIMAHEGIQGVGHIAYKKVLRGPRAYSREYYPEAERFRRFERQMPDAIRVVLDDIRTAKVLKTILGERKIDTATFMFPGGTSPLTHIEPHSLAINDDEDFDRRIGEISEEVNQGVWKFLEQFLKEGGKFTRVDRASTLKGENVPESIRDLQNSFCRGNNKYWEPSFSSTVYEQDIGKVKKPGDLRWVDPDGATNDLHDSTTTRVATVTYTRNDTEYEEAA